MAKVLPCSSLSSLLIPPPFFFLNKHPSMDSIQQLCSTLDPFGSLVTAAYNVS